MRLSVMFAYCMNPQRQRETPVTHRRNNSSCATENSRSQCERASGRTTETTLVLMWFSMMNGFSHAVDPGSGGALRSEQSKTGFHSIQTHWKWRQPSVYIVLCSRRGAITGEPAQNKKRDPVTNGQKWSVLQKLMFSEETHTVEGLRSPLNLQGSWRVQKSKKSWTCEKQNVWL